MHKLNMNGTMNWLRVSFATVALLCVTAGPLLADDGAATPTPAVAGGGGKGVKHWTKRFNKISGNSDSFTVDQLTAFRAAHAKKAAKNPAKRQAHIQKHFTKMDANADGKVTLAEFLAYKEAHHGQKHGKKNKPEANK